MILHRPRKNSTQLHMKKQKTQESQNNPVLNNNRGTSGGLTSPDFKPYYRAIVLKTAWYWHKKRQEDQWNQIEDMDVNPHIFKYLIFDKGAKNIK